MTSFTRILLVLLALVGTSTSLLAVDEFALRALNDNKRFYLERQETIIKAFLDDGSLPGPNELVQLSKFEHDFLSILHLHPTLMDAAPTLVISELDLRDFRFIPGQLIRCRALDAGLDLRKDRIRSQRFQLKE